MKTYYNWIVEYVCAGNDVPEFAYADSREELNEIITKLRREKAKIIRQWALDSPRK